MAVFYRFVSCFLILLPFCAQAQDPLTCCNNVAPVSLPKRLSNLGNWRMSLGVGGGLQYQRKRSDQSLYLGQGSQLSLTGEYFMKHHWGIRAMVGFQNLGVENQYVRLVYQDSRVPPDLVPSLLPKAGMQSFQAVIGPVVSIPIRRRLTMDLSYKFGAFYNNAPIVGAFDPARNMLVFRISPNNQRVGFGMVGTGSLLYRINPRFQIGLTGNAHYSKFGYTVDRTDGRFFSFIRRLGVLGGQFTLVYTFEKHAPPMAPALPTCFAPVLDASVPGRYEIGVDTRPVLKWRSNAPVYSDDERFLVRLFRMPGNQLLAENTVRDTQWSWPAKVALPDTSSFFLYTIQSTRTDYVDQTCRSELVTGTLEFFKRIAVVLPPVPEATTLTVELFEVQQVLGQVKAPATASRSTVRRSGKAGSGRSRTGAGQTYSRYRGAAPKTATGVVSVRESLIYREVTKQREVVWPAGVPYPQKPTIYRYVVRKAGAPGSAPLGNYSLLVEPGGAVRVLSEAEKQVRLKTPPKPAKTTPAKTPAPTDRNPAPKK
ncbi:MAG: hypothetical protein EAZ91_20990 [Cytophagales bacterium]|nr:MAG: hypothetical protein EAZ91_20990 [Cytophagales bacterium]